MVCFQEKRAVKRENGGKSCGAEYSRVAAFNARRERVTQKVSSAPDAAPTKFQTAFKVAPLNNVERQHPPAEGYVGNCSTRGVEGGRKRTNERTC